MQSRGVVHGPYGQRRTIGSRLQRPEPPLDPSPALHPWSSPKKGKYTLCSGQFHERAQSDRPEGPAQGAVPPAKDVTGMPPLEHL